MFHPLTAATGIFNVFRGLRENIEQHFILEKLRWSNDKHLERHALGNYWQAVTPTLDISLRMIDMFDNGNPPMSQFALRNKSGVPFDVMKMTFRAESAITTYEENITLYNVGKKYPVVSLPNIPVTALDVVDDKIITTTYTQYSLHIRRATQNGKTTIRNHTVGPIRPAHYSQLNSSWIRKWGYWINLDAIESEKRQLTGKLKYKLFGNRILPGSETVITWKMRRQFLRAIFFAAPLFIILSRPWIVNIWYWAPVVLKKDVLKWETYY